MLRIDPSELAYVAENLAEITRIPIRVYREKDLVCTFMRLDLPVDPAILYLDSYLKIEDEVSYTITENDTFYGIIHHDDYRLIMGPTYQTPMSRAQARDLLNRLGIHNPDSRAFLETIRGIVPMPLETFLYMLCQINYSLSGSKLNLTDVTLHGSLSEKSSSVGEPLDSLPESTPHDTYDFEQTMLQLVESGDTEGLTYLFSHSIAGTSGTVANTYTRQLKNIFISSVTLASRAAIRGGMSVDDALTLSDRFIQACEKYSTPEQIYNLNYNMILDYATRVQQLKGNGQYSLPVRNALAYIIGHLTDKITIEDLARASSLSRSQFTLRFTQETGMSPVDMIQKLKIEKAQQYLTQTNRSCLEISTALGFSSQSYFQKVFLKVTGMTPKKYREHPM